MVTEEREVVAAPEILAAAATRERKSTTAQERKSTATAARHRKSTEMAARGGKCATGAWGGKGGTASVQQIGLSAASISTDEDVPIDMAFTGAPSFASASRFTSSPTYAASPRSSGGPRLMSSFTMGSQAHHSMPPPWMHPPISEWDKDPVPPGGFMNFFQDQPNLSENAHFVGKTSHCAPVIPPRHFESSPSGEAITTTPPSSGNQKINMDNEEVGRTDKRIIWTKEEDYRLMSAWLKNSINPIAGTDKMNEQYWNDVATTYNVTTPSHRQRNMKQVKDRWHKINKWVDLFHSAWLKSRRLNTSGWNDQMWIDQAHKFYEDDNKDLKLGHFVLMDVWYLVRNEPKWATYNDGLKSARKRKTSDQREEEVNEEEDVMDLMTSNDQLGKRQQKRQRMK